MKQYSKILLVIMLILMNIRILNDAAFFNAHDVAYSNTDDDINVLDNSNSDGAYDIDKLDYVDDLDYADPDHSSAQCVSTGGRARLLSACTVDRPCQVIK